MYRAVQVSGQQFHVKDESDWILCVVDSESLATFVAAVANDADSRAREAVKAEKHARDVAWLDSLPRVRVDDTSKEGL